jgi:hypothetical protein
VSDSAPLSVTRLIPDLDDELCHALRQVEELLLTLASWEERAEDLVCLPAPLAGQVALDALERVQDVIELSQTSTGRSAPAGRVLGPTGDEHRPLRLVRVDPADLDVLTAAAAVLGLELAVNPGSELSDALAAGAEAAADGHGPPPTPVDLVEALSRAHGLLDLTPTVDSRRLTALITAASDTDLILSPADELAYHRTAERFTAMWARGNSLDRYLY